MIKLEWKALLKNKLLLIVLGAIALIPALYNLIFLGALWDPYGNIDHLPVAFVNHDKKVVYQGKELMIGQELADKLKEKKPLDFHFVSSEAAQKGIDDGKYYMVVTIPENFSKNATTLLSDDPKEMKLTYQTSQGTNLTASKMSNSVMTELKDQVSNEVTEMYSQALLTNLGDVGNGMSEAVDGGKQLSDGVAQLKDGTKTIADNLATLAASSLTFADGSKTVSEGLAQYITGVGQVADGAMQLNVGLGTLAGNLPELSVGTSQLATGATTLNTGIGQYTTGVGQVATGAQTLNTGLGQLAGQLPELAGGITQLAAGSQALNVGADQYVTGVTATNTGAQQISEGLQQLADQTEKLPQQVNTLREGTEKLTNGLQNVQLSAEEKEQLLNYTDNVSAYITQTAQALNAINLNGLNNVGQLTGVVNGLSEQLTAMTNSVATVMQQLNEAKAAIAQSYQADLTTNAAAVITALTNNGVALDEAQKALISTTMQGQNSQTLNTVNQLTLDTTQLSGQIEAQKQSLTILSTSLDALQNIPADQISQLKQGADQLNQVSGAATAGLKSTINGIYTIATQLVPGAQVINQGVATLDANMPTLAASIQQLAAGSTVVSQGTEQLAQNGSSITNGTNQLNQGLASLQQKTPELSSGVNQLADGAQQVAAGATQLSDKSPELAAGANQLATGLGQMNAKIPTLSSGVTALNDGAQQLVAGTGQLVANGGKLVDGTQQLQNGAQQIADGSGQLADGAQQVNQSLGTVGTGLGTLTNKLASGAKQIDEVNTDKAAAAAVAKPIVLAQKDDDTVANNGTGMAPYMMSVALFIGTITFNLLFDTFTPKKKPTTGLAWWASKASILAAVSIAQALLVYFVLTVFLGMHVLHPLQVLLFSILVSLTFMSIVTLFNLLLGKVGSFLMLIFMILQLAGSGGTYPIQLSSAFYRAINPYLPMTYSILALREGISIGGSMLPGTIIFGSLLLISNLLMILFFTKKRKNPTSFDTESSIG